MRYLVLLFLCSCGYTFSSKRKILKKFGIERLYIPKAKNFSLYSSADAFVTEAFTESFGGKQDLRIVDNKKTADGTMEITIDEVKVSTGATVEGTTETGKAGQIPSGRSVANSYSVTLTVRVNLSRHASLDKKAMVLYTRTISQSRPVEAVLNEGEFRDTNGIGLEGQINAALFLLAKDLSDQAKDEIFDVF